MNTRNMRNTENIIRHLQNESQKSNCNYKHSAAIIKNNKLYSIGYNYFFNNISIHAEIDACKKFLYSNNKMSLNNCDLIVIRSQQNLKKLKLSKPCIYCCKFLKEKGLRKIYYSDDNGNIVSEYINEMETNHKSSYAKCNYFFIN